MAASVANGIRQSGVLRVAGGVSAVAVVVAAVWFLGFDLYWSIAVVLAVIPVIALLITAAIEEDLPWELPWRESPRGIRLSFAELERSFDSCDRLGRPAALRFVRAALFEGRDDRQACRALARRVRALLAAELHRRGLDVGDPEDHHAILALTGTGAYSMLRPNDDAPVSAFLISESLEVIERLSAATTGAP